MKTLVKSLLVIIGASVFSPSLAVFGQTWLATGAPDAAWARVSCSADGNVIAATASGQPLSVSTNGGGAWTMNSSVPNCSAVALTADASKWAAISGGQIFTSLDSGNTWVTNSTPTNSLNYLAASANGAVLFASAGTPPYYLSTDWGQSWTNSGPNDSVLESVAISADGTRLIAACSTALVYTSPDSGVTWSPTTLSADEWTSVSSSADGSSLVAVSETGSIFASSDYGTNWTGGLVGADAAWVSVASSSNGMQVVAVNADGPEFQSADGGYTWSPTFSPNTMASDCSSADGAGVFAAQFNGPIFSLHPSPPFQIKATAGGVLLTWPDYWSGLYQLNASASLSEPLWEPVFDVSTDANGLRQLLEPATEAAQFYELQPVIVGSVKKK